MGNIRTNQRSFAGGEVTPEFWGRIDDAKFQAGLALCRNFLCLPHGPASNRPGTQFVREVKNSTRRVRLIPFTYSSDQTLVLELGHQYIRMHTQGGTVLDGSGVPYEVATPYQEADLPDLHYVQSADVLTIVHPGYAPRELRRLGAINWVLSTIDFTPSLAAPSHVTGSATLAASPNNLRDYSYQVTAVADDVQDESLGSTPVSTLTTVSIAAVTQSNPGTITTTSPHHLYVGQSVDVSGVTGMTQLNGTGYTVNTVPTSTTFTLKSGGVAVDTSGFSAYVSGGTVTPYLSNNLLQTGASNTITWDAVPGAVRYKVYLESNGLYGYIGETDGTTFTDDNISPDMSLTPPMLYAPFSGAGNYPGAVSYYQQRRVFAGTTNRPQNLWMTRTGTDSNTTYSLPTRDDDAIAVRAQTQQANIIRHAVPLQDLILLTSAAELRVSGVNSDAITPSSIGIKPQSYIGANDVPPVLVNNTLLFAAARGGHLREMAYNWQAGGFLTGDLSLRAPHLFDGATLVDLAYAKSPVPIVWAVSSTGTLLGLTYVPEQQVGAWHQHVTTGGLFEGVTVVTEGDEDVLYTVVQRQINGQAVRYIERMHSRQFATLADAYFVDCGLTYSGSPASTISGLDHLEGQTVSILADGAVHPKRVVNSGTINLDVPASVVHVGLPIQADMQTLPLVAQVDGGFGQGRQKSVNRVWVRVYRSSGVFVGPDAASLVEYKPRTIEPPGSPPSLKTGELELIIKNSWTDGGQLWVRQSNPLPLTVVSLTAETALGS